MAGTFVASNVVAFLLSLWAFTLVGVAPIAKVDLSYDVKPSLSLHEPVLVQLAIRNDLDTALRIDLGKNRVGNIHFVIQRPTGAVDRIDPGRQTHPDEASVRGYLSIQPRSQYSESILLNDWMHFDQVGQYMVSIEFLGSVEDESGSRVSVNRVSTLYFQIGPRNEQLLRQECERLVQAVLANSAWIEVHTAARALAAVDDPVAVQYLAKVIQARKQVDEVAIEGLERIGNEDAVRVLERAASSSDLETARYASAALARIRKMDWR